MDDNGPSGQVLSGRLSQGACGVVFLCVGIALVMISVTLAPASSIGQAVFLNLGIVAMAVPILEWLWGVCGGNPINRAIWSLGSQVTRLSKSIDVIESSKRVGLFRVCDRQANFGKLTDWVELLKEARSNVDLMGRTQFGWTRAKETAEVICNKIRLENVTFRWLIMSPENVFLPMIEETDVHAMLSRKIEIVLGFLREIHDSLPERLRSKLQVRVFSHVPLYCSQIRIDDRFYVTQYLCSDSADNSPFCCLKGSDGAWPKAHAQEFKSIWEASEDIFNAPDGRPRSGEEK